MASMVSMGMGPISKYIGTRVGRLREAIVFIMVFIIL